MCFKGAYQGLVVLVELLGRNSGYMVVFELLMGDFKCFPGVLMIIEKRKGFVPCEEGNHTSDGEDISVFNHDQASPR